MATAGKILILAMTLLGGGCAFTRSYPTGGFAQLTLDAPASKAPTQIWLIRYSDWLDKIKYPVTEKSVLGLHPTELYLSSSHQIFSGRNVVAWRCGDGTVRYNQEVYSEPSIQSTVKVTVACP
jgi:hypothetical protein